MRAFSDALDFIPMALAENSGLSSIQTVANIKSRQIAENNSRLGIDCMQNGDCGKTIYLYIYIYIYICSRKCIDFLEAYCCIGGVLQHSKCKTRIVSCVTLSSILEHCCC